MRARSLGFDVVLGLAGLVTVIAAVELTQSRALVDFVIRLSAIGIFATSLNLLVGYTGMVSFGHGMFYASGAYAFGLLLQKAGTSVPVAFLLTLGCTALLAAGVGAICARLGEIYFAFLTLAFQMLLHSLIVSSVGVTGGDQGLTGGIPRPIFLGVNLADQRHLYVASAALLVASLVTMRHVTRTPFGATLRMIRDNPARAPFLGVRVWRVRVLVFTMAGTFAAVGGIIMSLFVSAAYPEFAYWTTSGEAIFAIVMGGMDLFLGPLVGACALLLLNDMVTKFTQHYGMTLGILVLVFALGFRKGLADFAVQAVRVAGRERRPRASRHRKGSAE